MRSEITLRTVADLVMHLAFATQSLARVVRLGTSPADNVAWDALDQLQAQIDDVMATLAYNGVARAVVEGD
jgi:hypothetical protein